MLARYRLLIILIVITVLSFLAVDIFYTIATSMLRTVKKQEVVFSQTSSMQMIERPLISSYNAITTRNLFGSVEKAKDVKKIDVEALEVTKLNLVLRGTVASGGKIRRAIIENADTKQQELFSVGDNVAGATVIEIMRGIVVLRVGAEDEVLKMEETTQEESAPSSMAEQENTIKVDKGEIDNAFQNMNQILSQVRVQPYFSNGQPDGFMFSRIQRNSIFHKIGLRNGDVIQGVNNNPIGTAEDMLNLYREIKTGSEVVLNIKRGQKQQDLRYVFQ